MDIDHLVFDIGDRVTGWGELRQHGGEVWFDPPHGLARMKTDGPPAMSDEAVRLEGADLSATTSRPRGDGSTALWATVTGVWLGNAIRVEEQSAVRPAPWQRPEHTRPPCPPPDGGWPVRRPVYEFDNLECDLGDLEETGAAVSVTIFRPGPDQAVLVVAVADEAAVERQLRPQLGARLCVVPSRWTKSQVDGVTSVLFGQMRDWTLSTFGLAADEDGQVFVHIRLFRVLPDMARWATDMPDGLLEIEPVLTRADGMPGSA
jgi:hypothetical protein